MAAATGQDACAAADLLGITGAEGPPSDPFLMPATPTTSARRYRHCRRCRKSISAQTSPASSENPDKRPCAADRKPLRRSGDRRHLRVSPEHFKDLSVPTALSTSWLTTSFSSSGAADPRSASSGQYRRPPRPCLRALHDGREQQLAYAARQDAETFRPSLGVGGGPPLPTGPASSDSYPRTTSDRPLSSRLGFRKRPCSSDPIGDSPKQLQLPPLRGSEGAST